MSCHCDHDEDEDICKDCGEPISPYNFTGLCKPCARERAEEKLENEYLKAMERRITGEPS